MARSEWDAWPAHEPPPGFADRVVGATSLRKASTRRPLQRRRGVVGILLLVAAATLALTLRTRSSSSGDVTATARRELPLGPRATAVLERGARVSWQGDEVTQSAGEVFYRVARGGGFVVHTPAGNVVVKGTCFRVALRGSEQSGPPTGVASSPSAMVTVFEGKVAVTRSSASVDVTAGERAILDQDGVRRAGEATASAAGESPSGPAAGSNQQLAESVKASTARLAAIEAEKATLEQDLADARRKLGTQLGSDASTTNHSRDLAMDLSPQDWSRLAKEGGIKYQLPCGSKEDPTRLSSSIEKLGLAPDDALAVRSAYERSEQRMWSVVKALCVQASGSAEAAEKLGANACSHLIFLKAAEKQSPDLAEAIRMVDEIRAGEQPMPGPAEVIDPMVSFLLSLTGEMERFDRDLTESLGPDEAHRVAHGEGSCLHKEVWGQDR